MTDGQNVEMVQVWRSASGDASLYYDRVGRERTLTIGEYPYVGSFRFLGPVLLPTP